MNLVEPTLTGSLHAYDHTFIYIYIIYNLIESMRPRFGVKWSKVLEDGLVFNALDGAKKLGISTDEVGKKWETLKKGEGIIKFGGGFYCGKVDSIYVSWIAGRW